MVRREVPDMTIKEFSRLCGCNPQTLRYYDYVDLLKPIRVDSWTGYRYYREEQALLYVKIKNLQTAGFSIDEIKGLLSADNDTAGSTFGNSSAILLFRTTAKSTCFSLPFPKIRQIRPPLPILRSRSCSGETSRATVPGTNSAAT